MSEILHEVPEQRFVTHAEGHAAQLDYVEDDGRLTITHTIVPREIGGRGIAGELVRAALDYARDAGLKVVPQCSYADAWMRRHSEFDALRA